jgi:hypothetical protein
MFFRPATFAILMVFAASAVAAPGAAYNSQCNTGSLQCCKSTKKVKAAHL